MATKAIASTTRAQGGSITTTIPAEVARKLGIEPGGDLFWIEDAAGGYHVSSVRPDVREVLEAHENVISEYRDVFKALAE